MYCDKSPCQLVRTCIKQHSKSEAINSNFHYFSYNYALHVLFSALPEGWAIQF